MAQSNPPSGIANIARSPQGAVLVVPAQEFATPIVTLTQEQFDMLTTGASLRAHDRNFFFFCAGVFVTGLAVLTTAFPDSRPLADGWIIATSVFGLAALYVGSRAQVASGMVDSVKSRVRRGA